jgi:ATP-dependent DNA helicase RecG
MSENQNIEWKEKYFPIIEFAAKNGRVTNADVQQILQTNRTSAYRILQQLNNWLEMQGTTGKATYYVLKGF